MNAQFPEQLDMLPVQFVIPPAIPFICVVVLKFCWYKFARLNLIKRNSEKDTKYVKRNSEEDTKYITRNSEKDTKYVKRNREKDTKYTKNETVKENVKEIMNNKKLAHFNLMRNCA